ncbi:response regulator [Desulfobotulus sp. H1]|uniref:histidine kinase n=1 Tax=Desulfobotulus pelophilus TaxID=2823377 RepID=A0ABT3N696_9BACT|nr:response regulator [Desulfobotulus pelophilus]MCW7752983.1 response regulator [Desulfobotulus pelophilus]
MRFVLFRNHVARGLTQRIVVITAGCFFIAMVILTLLISRLLFVESQRSIVGHQQELVDMLVKRMENELEARSQTLQGFSRFIHDGEKLVSVADIEKLLSTRVRLLEYFNGGILVADERAVAIAETIFVPGRIGTAYPDRPHVIQAHKTKKPVFTRPYIGRATGVPLSTITVPVLSDSGRVIGFLFGNTLLAEDNLFKEISEETLGHQGTVFVLDPLLGMVVTASDYSLAMQILPEKDFPTVVDAVLSGSPSGKARDFRGEEVVYGSATLEKMGWKVIHTLPAAMVSGAGKPVIIKMSFFIVGLMVATSLVTVFLLRRELFPLQEVAETINAMATGKIPAQPLSPVRINEIEKICLAFNRLHAMREEQETVLREERDFLKSQFLQSSDGIVLLDRENLTIMEANPRLSEILGFSTQHLEGQSLLYLLNTDGEELKKRFTTITESPDNEVREYALLHAEGYTIHAMISATLVHKGADTCIMANVRDTTELKQTIRIKNEFVSTVSHELRTPLTAISGALGLIMGGALGEVPEKARGMLTIASNNCRRLSMLINDLLDMEKLSADKMRFDFQVQDISPLVQRVVQENQVYAEKYKVRYVLEDPLPFARVNVDAQRFIQILANLLSNAAKFSPEGGSVHLRMYCPDDTRVRIGVQDQGPGIPDNFRSRIFEKFSQSDATDNRSKDGTGLGLAITKALVEKMGGCIDFVSEEGRGTFFYFDLPLAHGKSAPMDCVLEAFPDSSPSEGLPAVSDGGVGEIRFSFSLPILVVEDDPDTALMLQALLTHGGYGADVAESVAEALERIRSRKYAAICLDLMLPDGNGVDLIKNIRSRPETKDLPIIVVSASVEEGRLAVKGAFNAIDWLEKPIEPRHLLDTVRKVVKKSTGEKPSILHVEDDEDLGKILAAIGEDVARFDLAPNLKDAFHKIKNFSYDLIILDIQLPDGSGWELLPLIHAMEPSPPVLVLSSSELSHADMGRVHGALTKGKVANDRILEALKSILAPGEEIHEK